VKDELTIKSGQSVSARAKMSAVSKRMDISSGVDSAADFVDQGYQLPSDRASGSSRAPIFLSRRNMPPPPLPTSRTDIGRPAGKSVTARFNQSRGWTVSEASKC